MCRNSGRPFILTISCEQLAVTTCLLLVNTYFARALEAVFAITVLARLETAVITSISFSEVGGFSLMLVSLGRVTSHEGIYIQNNQPNPARDPSEPHREEFLNSSRDAKSRR